MRSLGEAGGESWLPLPRPSVCARGPARQPNAQVTDRDQRQLHSDLAGKPKAPKATQDFTPDPTAASLTLTREGNCLRPPPSPKGRRPRLTVHSQLRSHRRLLKPSVSHAPSERPSSGQMARCPAHELLHKANEIFQATGTTGALFPTRWPQWGARHRAERGCH